MLLAFAMLCSCQRKHLAAVEQQLTERTRQLDARETALDKRDQALDKREGALSERERELAEREKAIANAVPPSGQISDPAQVKADRDRRIEQLPAEVRALIPDPPQVNSVDFEKQAEAMQSEHQSQSPDAAQVKAAREKRIQQLPPEVRALIPDPAQMNSIKFENKAAATPK